MKKSNYLKLLLPFLTLGIMSSCSSTEETVGPELDTYQNMDKPEDVVMASAEKRPLWSLDLDQWKKEFAKQDRQYFVGEKENGVNRNMAESQAKLEAQNEISNAIAASISESIHKTQTTSSVTGNSDSEVTDIFEVISRRLKKSSQNLVSGAQREGVFWWKRKTANGGFVYDAWALLSVSNQQMKKNIQSAARKALVKDQKTLNAVLKEVD